MHGHLNVKFVKSNFFVISEMTDCKENNISLLFKGVSYAQYLPYGWCQ